MWLFSEGGQGDVIKYLLNQLVTFQTEILLRSESKVSIGEKKGIPRCVLWQLDNNNLWTSLIHFGSEQDCPLPLLSPPQSNNSAQYGCLRNRWCYSALKTVKPYYGNRYQISLSNRFCHPMKNCWQQRSVWLTISKTSYWIWMISSVGRTSVMIWMDLFIKNVKWNPC